LYDAAGEPRQLWFDPKLEHNEFLAARPKVRAPRHRDQSFHGIVITHSSAS
jgi:hypothetical protein